ARRETRGIPMAHRGIAHLALRAGAADTLPGLRETPAEVLGRAPAMKRCAALATVGAMALGFPADAATTVRVPAVAVCDASETLVAIAANGASEGGSTLGVFDAGTGAALSSVAFDSRTNGLFFCGSKALLAWTDKAVVRIDPRSGAEEPVMPLAEGERIAVAPRCDSVVAVGAAR